MKLPSARQICQSKPGVRACRRVTRPLKHMHRVNPRLNRVLRCLRDRDRGTRNLQKWNNDLRAGTTIDDEPGEKGTGLMWVKGVHLEHS